MLNTSNRKHRELIKEYGRAHAKRLLAGAGFAATLHAAVDTSGYTRQQLAESIGVTKGALDKWLNGTQYPAVHLLWRLCIFVHPDYDPEGNVIPSGTKHATEALQAYAQQISLER